MQKGLGRYQDKTPYEKTKPCNSLSDCQKSNGCHKRELFCVNRGRFHLSLAALGKTALSVAERKLLASNDIDGGINLRNKNITNPVFLYEQSEMMKDYVWDELAEYLDVSKIPHDLDTHSLRVIKTLKNDFCEEKYDNFRAIMMPYAYDLSVWLQDYFIPVARNESSSVTIPNIDAFTDLIENYKKDPCQRLDRSKNGTYFLKTEKRMSVDNA